MPHPIVSFIVPCYRLGNFLRENVESILAQGTPISGVLIMDDCFSTIRPRLHGDSATRASFAFATYRTSVISGTMTHGISLARGRYIWLIFFHDDLRCPHVLGRYVGLLNTYRRSATSFVLVSASQTIEKWHSD